MDKKAKLHLNELTPELIIQRLGISHTSKLYLAARVLIQHAPFSIS